MPGPRRVPPPRRPRPSWRRTMGVPDDHVLVCEDGDQLVLDDDGHARAPAGCRPATSTSTASSATSATACCATAGCWPRRAWSWSSSRVDVDDRRDHHRPRGHHPRLGATRPRPRTCSTSAQTVVADAVKDAFAERRRRHRDAAARRAPGRRPVRQRPHQAPPDDRPRRDVALTVGPRCLRRCGRVGTMTLRRTAGNGDRAMVTGRPGMQVRVGRRRASPRAVVGVVAVLAAASLLSGCLQPDVQRLASDEFLGRRRRDPGRHPGA